MRTFEMFDPMIALEDCPRCGGAVLDYRSPITDSPLCITCGWRRAEISAEVLAEVEAYKGKPYMEDRYTHKQIGTGKPPLSGWEREKRRRERNERRQAGELAAG